MITFLTKGIFWLTPDIFHRSILKGQMVIAL